MQSKDQKHHWKNVDQSAISKLLVIRTILGLHASFVTGLYIVLYVWDSLVRDSQRTIKIQNLPR